MRRLLVLLVSMAAAVVGTLAVVAPAGPATAQDVPNDPRAGLIYDGLRRSSADSLCHGAFESLIESRVTPGMLETLCTHGPDPAPDGIDVRADRGPDPAAELGSPAASVAGEGAVQCYGTGSDGYRVQLVYARGASSTDRYATYAASFRSWAARMDGVVNDSAAETGGTRHVRFVTDSLCNPTISRATVSGAAMSSFSSLVSELHAQGYTRSDRKYVVWTDANVYCGISELYVDDSADATPGRNYNNGNTGIKGAIGRIDNGCWGATNLVEAHELLHLLGGVQTSAPNATPGFHCTDESDRLCYNDGSGGGGMRQVCPPAHEALYDCNHDDYFSTAPQPGSYLATHWNTANSAFLSQAAPIVVTTTTLPPPTTTIPLPTTTVPPTTTTVAPTTTTTAPTTTTVAPTTTTAAPTTTTPPPAAGVPSAPVGLMALQPAVGSGIQLAWSAPSTGPVTGYRIYRGSSPYGQTLLTTVGNVLGYNDASAAPTLYYYVVRAYNAAGDGPPSNIAGMIGKAATAAGIVQQDVDRRLVPPGARMGILATRRWA